MVYNCFTVLCGFLLHNKANQARVYVYPSRPCAPAIPALRNQRHVYIHPSRPCAPATPPLGDHGAQMGALCPTAAPHEPPVLCTAVYLCQCRSPVRLPLPSAAASMPILCVCVSIPALQTGSSVPLFLLPLAGFICVRSDGSSIRSSVDFCGTLCEAVCLTSCVDKVSCDNTGKSKAERACVQLNTQVRLNDTNNIQENSHRCPRPVPSESDL